MEQIRFNQNIDQDLESPTEPTYKEKEIEYGEVINFGENFPDSLRDKIKPHIIYRVVLKVGEEYESRFRFVDIKNGKEENFLWCSRFLMRTFEDYEKQRGLRAAAQFNI